MKSKQDLNQPLSIIMSGPAGLAYIVSLGCPKNLVDTERYVATLNSLGYSLTPDMHNADLLFVNTCGFIDQAKQESIDVIQELVENRLQHQKIIVAGCLVDRYASELKAEIPEVDLWTNLSTFSSFTEDLVQLAPVQSRDSYITLSSLTQAQESRSKIPWAGLPRFVLTPRHTAYLKISEGCDHSCSFCAIPTFRGRQQSVPLSMLVEEARSLVQQGARELVLIGQDTIAYGKDIRNLHTTARGVDANLNLFALLQALNTIDGLEWIRVMYTYPTRLADEILLAYQSIPKLVHYLDLPLQHLSDPVLERMRRGTPYQKIRDHVFRLRQAIPDLIIRSTCIVGFPGETQEDFSLLSQRFDELDVDHLGVFRYSDEDGTRAYDLDQKIPLEIAESRHEELADWAYHRSAHKSSSHLGSIKSILVDSTIDRPGPFQIRRKKGCSWYVGRWYGQAPDIDGVVYFQSQNLQPGDFVQAQLTDLCYPDFLATVIQG